jgi:hypothetical protein
LIKFTVVPRAQKAGQYFFERGFNNCDIAYLEKSVGDNLKFYHDKGGFQDKKLFLERTQQNICGNPNQKPIRKVIENSLEVFPLYNNGEIWRHTIRRASVFYP